MRMFLCLLLVSIVVFRLSNARTAEASNVHIGFVHPERFTDFRIQGRQETESAQIFRDQVSSCLSPIVAKRFPGGTLSLRFTDIDLAGRLEPWRIRRFNDVRFDFDGSPLRLYFDYTLSDSKGRVLASGSKNLVESYYLHRYIGYPNSEKVATLFYEKAALSRCFSSLTLSGSPFAKK